MPVTGAGLLPRTRKRQARGDDSAQRSTVPIATPASSVMSGVMEPEVLPLPLDRQAHHQGPEDIGRLLVSGEGGIQVPLAQVADIDFAPGPAMVRSENGYLNDLFSIDVRGRDVGGYVAEAKQIIARRVAIPAGYRLEWSGQYEALERVKARLEVVVPITLAVIALLLYLNFGTLTQALMVMLSLPFALIGGVWMMWLLDYNLSVAVAVGFIALAGVAAETGVVMLIYLDNAFTGTIQERKKQARPVTASDLHDAVIEGAVERVRPKMMTVSAIMAGLLPILWSTGTGSEVMQRIAVPMVGGMISSTILTLIVIPAIYSQVKLLAIPTAHREPLAAQYNPAE